MSNTYKIRGLKDRFCEYEVFSQDDLHKFYHKYEPELKRSTLRWRIYELKKRELIKTVGRGQYTLQPKNKWEPELTDELKNIYNAIHQAFPYAEYCLWTTNWIRPFMHHIPASYSILVETEKNGRNGIQASLRYPGTTDIA